MEPRTKSRHVAKREFWQHQISKWKASGLSQKQYCGSRSLALSTFCYWKSRISKPESTAPRFYPLVIPDSHTTPSDAGFCIWMKRLEKDVFRWPESEKEVVEVSQTALGSLLQGFDLQQAHNRLFYDALFLDQDTDIII